MLNKFPLFSRIPRTGNFPYAIAKELSQESPLANLERQVKLLLTLHDFLTRNGKAIPF